MQIYLENIIDRSTGAQQAYKRSTGVLKGSSNKNILCKLERSFEIPNKSCYGFFISCLILEIFNLDSI